MRYRCYLWKSFDGSGAREPAEPEADEEQSSEGEDGPRQRKRALLRDADGVYYLVAQPT